MKNAKIENVSSFRGYSVINGQVDISENEYVEFLDDAYENAEICGCKYGAGDALKSVDPVAFRCGLGDYESEIQSELEDELENEDYSSVEWIEDLEEDEE